MPLKLGNGFEHHPHGRDVALAKLVIVLAERSLLLLQRGRQHAHRRFRLRGRQRGGDERLFNARAPGPDGEQQHRGARHQHRGRVSHRHFAPFAADVGTGGAGRRRCRFCG